MIFPIEYSDCFVMDNDDLDDILRQLGNGNTFKCKITQPYNGSKEICSFKARVNNPTPNHEAVEFYWMTNDERRSLIRKLKGIKEKGKEKK